MTEARSAALMSLAIECSPLLDLRGWQPVSELLETYASAIRGGDGITRKEIAKMRQWSSRWVSLHQSLRDFYVAEIVDPGATTRTTVNAALLHIMTGKPILDGRAYGILRGAWEARYGHPPGMEMAPSPRQRREAP